MSLKATDGWFEQSGQELFATGLVGPGGIVTPYYSNTSTAALTDTGQSLGYPKWWSCSRRRTLVNVTILRLPGLTQRTIIYR